MTLQKVKKTYCDNHQVITGVWIAILSGLFLALFMWAGRTMSNAQESAEAACAQVEDVKKEVVHLKATDEKAEKERNENYKQMSGEIKALSKSVHEMTGSLKFLVEAEKHRQKEAK